METARKIAPIGAVSTRLPDIDGRTEDQIAVLDDLASLKSDWLTVDQIRSVIAASPFLGALISLDPSRFEAIAGSDPHDGLIAAEVRLHADIAAARSEAEAMAALRHYRQVLALTTALADLAGRWTLKSVSKALARGADISIAAALDFAVRMAFKAETAPDNALAGYAVIAMGKHGAMELNYSSDIDLVVVFDPDVAIVPPGKEVAPHFVRLTQMMAKLLQSQTADGHAFRVDLRLRPDPSSTPVAVTLHGALNYYEALGQNWERAAYIKARHAAGDSDLGREFLDALAPFVWRRHLDYAAIADIHALKRQINVVKGLGEIAVEGHNIKLGRGGIREIEFFVQTQQLIAGGRAPHLRMRRTLEALDGLTAAGWIREKVRDDLRDAYIRLRTIENRLQMMRDEQTHELPSSAHEITALAHLCGFDDLNAFAKDVEATFHLVQDHYEALFAHDGSASKNPNALVFSSAEPNPETLKELKKAGFDDPESVWHAMARWHQGHIAATRNMRARELLNELTPALFDAMEDTGNPDRTFIAFDRFVSQLPAGIQLFSMLNANRNLLALLMAILGTAPRLARALVRRPTLLDSVIDPRFFGEAPERSVIAEALDASLATCRGYEDTLDMARLVGQDQSFLIGVRQLTGNLGFRAASKAYTALADLLVDRLLKCAWNAMCDQHGNVPGGRVAVLGMGTFGACQMTAASDLDLILIYDYSADAKVSDGPRPLAPGQYFARLTQRLIAAIAAQTAHGSLYEVDMRLRPSGRSGPVATHIDSFVSYQHEQAWVWEHMALTRARPICGDADLMNTLDDAIRDTLQMPRDISKVMAEALDMRRRLEAEKPARSIWDLKTTKGGLFDIDFIVQACLVAYGDTIADHGAIGTADGLEILTSAQVLDPQEARVLREALDFTDALLHRIAVCSEGDFDPETAPTGLLARLTEAVAMPDFTMIDAHLIETQSTVRRLFNRRLCVDTDTAST